jgi:hypothetical protein
MLVCHFCNAEIESVEAAVENDWVPSFWYPGDASECNSPVCGNCADEVLELDEDGELVYVGDD